MKKSKKTSRRPHARTSRKKKAPSSPAGLHGDKLQHNFDGAVRLLLSGKLARAERLCRKILKTNPHHSDALHVLGLACRDQGRLEEGAGYLGKAAAINKTFADIPNNLGTTLNDLGRHEEAIEAFRRAIEIQPGYVTAHSNLGVSLRNVGRLEEAISSYRQAIAIEPGFMEAHTNLAIAFEELGNVDEAVASCRRALKSASSSRTASIDVLNQLYSLSKLQASPIDADILTMIDEAEPEVDVSKEEFESLRAAARATLLDKAGRHTEAWENLVIANRLPFRQKQDEYLRERQQRQASLAWLRNVPAAKIPDDVDGHTISLHILGPSRSGKTTLENLAATLDGAVRGFENRIVKDAWNQALDASDLPPTTPSIDLSPALEAQFRKYYFEELEKQAGDAKIFTNTVPRNIEAVSCLAATIPCSRFIFLQRDVNDICLRIYMKIYNLENTYAYDIDNILEYVTWYNDMIDILAERFPRISKVVRYEDMIADPAATLRSVAALCGTVVPPDVDLPRLGDDRGCAEPYKTFIDAER